MKDLLIFLVNKPSTLFVLYFVILRVKWFSKFIMLSIVYFFKDAKFGVLSLLPNLLSGYGWNPGLKLYNWMGEVIEKKVGNKDITFGEVNGCHVVKYIFIYCHSVNFKFTIWKVGLKFDLRFNQNKILFREENRGRCVF